MADSAEEHLAKNRHYAEYRKHYAATVREQGAPPVPEQPEPEPPRPSLFWPLLTCLITWGLVYWMWMHPG